MAWGNSLGDMSADLAMARKGFTEMAITGTMAGPVLNILLGQGLGLILRFVTSQNPSTDSEPFSLWKTDNSLNKTAVLPFGLLICQFIILTIILYGSIKYNFKIDLKLTKI